MGRLLMDSMSAFLRAPMVRWRLRVDRMSTDQRMELEGYLAQFAVLCARASAYIGRRHTGGTHEAAVLRQNAVARKVRQALGYTYAGADRVDF